MFVSVCLCVYVCLFASVCRLHGCVSVCISLCLCVSLCATCGVSVVKYLSAQVSVCGYYGSDQQFGQSSGGIVAQA